MLILGNHKLKSFFCPAIRYKYDEATTLLEMYLYSITALLIL